MKDWLTTLKRIVMPEEKPAAVPYKTKPRLGDQDGALFCKQVDLR